MQKEAERVPLWLNTLYTLLYPLPYGIKKEVCLSESIEERNVDTKWLYSILYTMSKLNFWNEMENECIKESMKNGPKIF